jgi:hypothetical protein
MAVSTQRSAVRSHQATVGGVCVWLCLLGVAGCTFPDAYTGPFRGLNEVGVLTGQARFIGNHGYGDVYINSIDGQRAIGGWTAPSQEVHVLPGLRAIGVVEARVLDAAGFSEEFADQAVLRFKVIVGAHYALGYDPKTKQFAVVRVGLGPVPFESGK